MWSDFGADPFLQCWFSDLPHIIFTAPIVWSNSLQCIYSLCTFTCPCSQLWIWRCIYCSHLIKSCMTFSRASSMCGIRSKFVLVHAHARLRYNLDWREGGVRQTWDHCSRSCDPERYNRLKYHFHYDGCIWDQRRQLPRPARFYQFLNRKVLNWCEDLLLNTCVVKCTVLKHTEVRDADYRPILDYRPVSFT